MKYCVVLKFLRKLNFVSYVCTITTTAFVLEILAGLAVHKFQNYNGIQNQSTKLLVLTAIFVSPIIETCIAQWIPYETLGRFGFGDKTRFFVCWTIFVVLHLSNGAGSSLVAGFVGGFFLTLTYYIWRNVSVSAAFIATIVCHSINNILALAIIYGSGLA
jgi:hypothetical protein